MDHITITRLDLQAIPVDLLQKLPYRIAQQYEALPFRDDGTVHVVCVDPTPEITTYYRWLYDKNIEVYCAEKSLLWGWIQKAYEQNLSTTNYTGDAPETSFFEENLLDTNDASPSAQALTDILKDALHHRASDIHFEPQETHYIVRIRVDGLLALQKTLPLTLGEHLITRIKTLAKLDIAQKRTPQDGRLKRRFGQKNIDVRLSFVPTLYGERLVMRLLDHGAAALDLRSLHLPEDIAEEFVQVIHRNEGLILVSGPTGSGKTTTLYSALLARHNPTLNIMTIEDPIEYKLHSAGQMAVHPEIGLTFAKGLRHILRQDPDIIMIGEIRDSETAKIAVQAAMTGHLVFATIHANDAPSTIHRLLDMGIDKQLLLTCILGIMAQRLLPKISSSTSDTAYPKTAGRCALFEWLLITPEVRKILSETNDVVRLKNQLKNTAFIPLKKRAEHLFSSKKIAQNDYEQIVQSELI